MMHPSAFPLRRHPRPDIGPPPVVGAPQDDAGAGPSSSNPPMPGSFPDGDSPDAPPDASTPYEPSVLDVVVAKAMMTKAFPLPLELVDRIIDFAEYWPHTSTQIDYGASPHAVARGDSRVEDVFMLRTLPLGFVKPVHPDPAHYKEKEANLLRLSAEHPIEQFHEWIGSPSHTVEHPCRKIVFTITSNDQGWGGSPDPQNAYRGSYTWFEAGLERIDASGECGDRSPDHSPNPTDETAASATAPRPYISPDAMRPIVPAVVVGPDQQLRMEHPLLGSQEYKIQCNKTAKRTPETHVVEWRADDDIDPDTTQAQELVDAGRGKATGTGEFVRKLKLGDAVTVWAKARFAGWSNNVRCVKVDVYWRV